MYHYTKLGVLFKNMFTLFISMCVRLYTCVYMCVGMCAFHMWRLLWLWGCSESYQSDSSFGFSKLRDFVLKRDCLGPNLREFSR